MKILLYSPQCPFLHFSQFILTHELSFPQEASLKLSDFVNVAFKNKWFLKLKCSTPSPHQKQCCTFSQTSNKRIQDLLGIINCEGPKILPHLQANKVACQFHRYPLPEAPVSTIIHQENCSSKRSL